MRFQDEIVDEVRKTREAYSAQFDFDLTRMFEDLSKKEKLNLALRADIQPLKPHQVPGFRREAQCDPSVELSDEDREWLEGRPVGGELI